MGVLPSSTVLIMMPACWTAGWLLLQVVTSTCQVINGGRQLPEVLAELQAQQGSEEGLLTGWLEGATSCLLFASNAFTQAMQPQHLGELFLV